ncbi:MAG: signal peptide peptidase SppA [Steroidobacteraceae bacterium]|jgi:protease-4
MRPVQRFFSGLWHGLDVLRRVLHLIALLALFLIILVLLHQSTPRLPEHAALVLRPSGAIVEQLTGEPFERAINQAEGNAPPETLLWDLTEAIHAAAGDSRIQAILIDTDDMSSAGQAKLEELGAALAEFRKSGKKVIARGSRMGKSQFYLAAQADELYLDPFGAVLIDGYERFRLYYKDALDKLGIEMHLFRAGKFKSAEEPYIRRDMSPEDKEASAGYLQALWSGYRSAIASARGKSAEDVAAYADGYFAAVKAAGGDLALVAKNAGLVTDLRTPAQVEKRMVELVGTDSDTHTFHAVDLQDYLRVVHIEQKLHRDKSAAIGIVSASGEILDGNQPPGSVGGESTSRLLRQARFDPDIKAVVLRIDSPGGSVLASEQIYREVQALRTAGKPVIASMSDLAASGGYYIAAPADAIVASANSITGSIGVFASVPTFEHTLEKLGVHTDGFGTTTLSGATRLDRPMSPGVSELLQTTVSHTYEEFLARVALGRSKTRDEVDAIAQGRVWAGSDALRLGLVDRIGTYEDAVKLAAERAHLGTAYRIKRIEPELTLAQQLFFEMHSDRDTLLRVIGFAPHTSIPLLAQIEPVTEELERLKRLAAPGAVAAYCFCRVE